MFGSHFASRKVMRLLRHHSVGQLIVCFETAEREAQRAGADTRRKWRLATVGAAFWTAREVVRNSGRAEHSVKSRQGGLRNRAMIAPYESPADCVRHLLPD